MAALEKESFDLILMDLQMPEMSGLEATAHIRANEKGTGKHLPIVALTARAMTGDRQRCLDAGMDGYLAKPIHAKELFEVLEALVPAGTSRSQTEFGNEDEGGRMNPNDAPTLPASRILNPSEKTTEIDVFDRNEALARLEGDEELLRNLVEMFLANSAKLLSDIKSAITDGDPVRLERTAHTLKSSVGIFGAAAASRATLRLELIGHAEMMMKAEEAYIALETEINRLRQGLTGLLPTLHGRTMGTACASA